MAARTPSTYATSSSRIADGSVGAVVGIAGVDAVTGPGGIGGVARVGDDDGIDGLGAVQAGEVGLDAEIGGRGVAPSVITDLLMWATALTFSIRNTYRHPVARLEGFLTQDRRATCMHASPPADPGQTPPTAGDERSERMRAPGSSQSVRPNLR
jgi:hypothetical protein